MKSLGLPCLLAPHPTAHSPGGSVGLMNVTTPGRLLRRDAAGAAERKQGQGRAGERVGRCWQGGWMPATTRWGQLCKGGEGAAAGVDGAAAAAGVGKLRGSCLAGAR